jgi:uncharacterized protein (TIGR03435 family)
MPRPFRFTCAVFSLTVWLVQFCAAQAPAASPTFIAATIKPSDPNRTETGSSMGWNAGGSFEARSVSLKQLIEFAQDYGYLDVDQRIVGGPKWTGSAKFDIKANCDEATASTFGKAPEKQQIRLQQSMVQSLLADRFKLRTHHELRRLPVYALVLASDKPRVKPSADATPDEFSDTEGPPGNWKADDVMMKALADDLSGLPEIGGKIVVDKTGLKGAFAFTLKWTPDPTMGATPPGPDSGVKPDPSAPSLLTALREQLGLKLITSKEPVDVIVIDFAELSSPN